MTRAYDSTVVVAGSVVIFNICRVDDDDDDDVGIVGVVVVGGAAAAELVGCVDDAGTAVDTGVEEWNAGGVGVAGWAVEVAAVTTELLVGT